MTQITLNIKEKNLGSVLGVLNALKDELIENMDLKSINKKDIKKIPTTRYQPKQNRVIYEDEQIELEKNGKYLKPSEFKKKLR